MQKGQAPVLILIGILIIMTAAGGAFYLGRQTTPKPSPNPVVTSTTLPSPKDASPVPNGTEETTNWKTYTNKETSFEFKYPPILVKEDIESGVLFSDKDIECSRECPTRLGVGVSDNRTDFDKIYSMPEGASISNYTPFETLVKVRNIIVGGLPATQYKTVSDPALTTRTFALMTVIKYKNVFIEFNSRFGIVNKEYDDRFSPLYDQILSTFKFL